MTRFRHNNGLIITLTPESPYKQGRTIRVSAGTLAAIQLGAFIFATLAVLSFLVFMVQQRDVALLRDGNRSLENQLLEYSSALQASQEQVSEMSLVTGELIEELGSVGALVREVQELAGLEPDAEVAALGAVESQRMQSNFALGGLSASALPVSSVDRVASNLDTLIDVARSDLTDLTKSIGEVRSTVEYQQAVELAKPKEWPVKGWISSYFGWRRSPFTGRGQQHRGMDIVAPYRSPIQAPAAGVVVKSGWSSSGYGYHTVIDHGYGYKTLYAHMTESILDVGQAVEAGDTVGYVGNTGYSTGPHLHYEILVNNVPTDPDNFLP